VARGKRVTGIALREVEMNVAHERNPRAALRLIVRCERLGVRLTNAAGHAHRRLRENPRVERDPRRTVPEAERPAATRAAAGKVERHVTVKRSWCCMVRAVRMGGALANLLLQALWDSSGKAF
jgi:hypothetical protein